MATSSNRCLPGVWVKNTWRYTSTSTHAVTACRHTTVALQSVHITDRSSVNIRAQAIVNLNLGFERSDCHHLGTVPTPEHWPDVIRASQKGVWDRRHTSGGQRNCLQGRLFFWAPARKTCLGRRAYKSEDEIKTDLKYTARVCVGVGGEGEGV